MNTINIRGISTINEQYPVWFPYKTPFDTNKLSLAKGKGTYVYDIYDKKYFDLSSGLWNVTLGYGNEGIINSISNQLSKLGYCSLFEYSNDLLLSSSFKLISFMNLKNYKVLYSCSGSESIEVAIKIMRQYWSLLGEHQKKLIISFKDSYHGTTYGAMSISNLENMEFNTINPMLGSVAITTPKYKEFDNKSYVNTLICHELEELHNFIKNNKNIIAGIVIEPILSSKGVYELCEYYLKTIITICKQNNILVAFDEVATGFYRCGSKFYYSKLKVEPDIVCISKAINSGYLPLGGTVISDRIIKEYSDNSSIIPHGSTQGGNLLSCAAMDEALNQYIELEKSENLSVKGNQFLLILKESLSNIDCVKQVRGVGFFYSVDLKCYDISLSQYILLVKQHLENNGILVYHSEVGISLLPMIITSIDEWNMVVKKVRNILQDIS